MTPGLPRPATATSSGRPSRPPAIAPSPRRPRRGPRRRSAPPARGTARRSSAVTCVPRPSAPRPAARARPRHRRRRSPSPRPAAFQALFLVQDEERRLGRRLARGPRGPRIATSIPGSVSSHADVLPAPTRRRRGSRGRDAIREACGTSAARSSARRRPSSGRIPPGQGGSARPAPRTTRRSARSSRPWEGPDPRGRRGAACRRSAGRRRPSTGPVSFFRCLLIQRKIATRRSAR